MRLIDADVMKELILKERDAIPKTLPAAPYELGVGRKNKHGNSMRGGIRKALRCMEQTPNIDPVHANEEKPECEACGYKCLSQIVSALPNCNDCGKKTHCEYLPRLGGDVRINCPIWVKEEV